ncbi:MAG: tRNA-uridine aminocarboxypropyltransferase [Rhodoferax sp.]|nr:tRNA-uridine aminocarboxypropyltransferase [Rhodoferax sp.]
MTAAPPTKRLHCTRCLRAQSACICHWAVPTEHLVEVLILQHPMEESHAKGSARLLHLSLPNSCLVTGEVFAPPTLQALLTDPLPHPAPMRQARHPVLLYPQTPQDQAMGLPAPPMLPPELLGEPSQLRLIVLDGTWRKSRKMLYRNPLLQSLPRLSLQDTGTSRYLIRQAHRPDQLSTLEATCAALTQLESCAERYTPLLAAFDNFVSQQLAYR